MINHFLLFFPSLGNFLLSVGIVQVIIPKLGPFCCSSTFMAKLVPCAAALSALGGMWLARATRQRGRGEAAAGRGDVKITGAVPYLFTDWPRRARGVF